MPPSPTQPPLPPSLSPNARVDDLYDYLKSIRQGEGMESITQFDVNVFTGLMKDVTENLSQYDKSKLANLFDLLEQIGSSEGFVNALVKDSCLMQVRLYRDELGL